MTTTWFLFVFSALLCCRLSECFHPYQQTFFWHSSALQRSLANPLSRLNAKGFGKISHASDEVGGKKTEDNNSDIDDILLQTIAAKEAEFQAELDKMLAEAKASNALAGKGGLDGFSNEDLSKAIVEMQQLRKQQEAADGTVLGKETIVSEDGYQIVKLVIPPGLRPGEVMVVQLRSGMFEIEVPEGVQEGDEIEVELPM